MERAPLALKEAMRIANQKSSMTLVSRIKRDKLVGQVLHRLTGTLIRSWMAIIPPIPGVTGTGAESGEWIGGAGSNLDYADYHEFGFKGSVAVRAHRRRAARTRLASAWGARGKDKFRARPKNAAEHDVKAHTREVNYAGKPYARPALRECKDKIIAHHHEALREAVARGFK